MNQSLKQTCFDIWNTKDIRRGLQSSFQPLFIRYIGIENNQEYNDILKTFDSKIKENPEISIFFENEIPFPQNFELMNAVSESLKTMDINHFKNDDIVIFNDSALNQIFIDSLNYVLNIAYQKENFINISTKNSFITKLVLWTYEHTKNIDFTQNKNPKCIYFGSISNHAVYFLLLLYHMTFDVIYINPLKDELFNELDIDHLSTLCKFAMITPIDTWKSRIQNAKILTYDESFLYQMQNQIDTQLYGNGVYKPWQLRGYNTISISKQSTIIDLENNINEPAKVRDGFIVNEKVNIPCFFMKIDGVYQNFAEYKKLIEKCSQSPLVKTYYSQFSFINHWEQSNMYQIAFTQLSDGTFNIEELKKLSFYHYQNYKPEIQDFLLNKMNETISNHLFKNVFSKEDLLKYIMDLLNLNEDFIRLVDNFDFANEIPKIIIFLEKESVLSSENLFILGYLHQIGFDIIIFDPSGMTNTENVLDASLISNIRLDYMKYDLMFEEVKKKEKKGFFDRFLKG